MKLYLIFITAALLLSAAICQGEPMNRAQWIADGTYGLMTHWFIYPDIDKKGESQAERTAYFNKRVNDFDLNGYMKQFDESGANWLCFTLSQSNGYWNTKNAYLDKHMPGHTPDRDLALEIAKAVKARGKHFIIYIAGNPLDIPKYSPGFDKYWGWDPKTEITECEEFEPNWLEYMKDLSLHFGKLCDGWWVDGLYPELHKNKWHFDKWIKCLRAGNPNSAVSLSDGSFCVGKLKPLCEGLDYFPGETHLIEDGMIRTDFTVGGPDDYGEGKMFYLDSKGKVRKQGSRPEFFMPAVQYIGGTQLHSLLALDMPFSPMPVEWVSHSKEDLLKFVRNMKNAKGGVTINVPIGENGEIQQSSLDKLIYLKENLK